MKRALIIDCDPGVDDAVALLWAFCCRDAFDILGVTTVSGNVGAAQTARNACTVRQLANREEIPVFAGAHRSLMGATVPADHFHGANGLGDLTFAAPQAPLARQHAVHFICDTLRAAPEKSVSLAITGPMTNLALALLLAPDIALSVREIVIMGGAREAGGNVTASAEYNIYADAHAASIVLGSGLPIVLIGLDVTHKVRTTPERLAPFAASASPSARAIFDLLRFSEKVERQHAGCEGAPMHDPAVIAYLLDATLFETKPCSVQVETASPLTLGHTAIDLRSPGANAIRWAVDADAEGLFALLTRSIA